MAMNKKKYCNPIYFDLRNNIPLLKDTVNARHPLHQDLAKLINITINKAFIRRSLESPGATERKVALFNTITDCRACMFCITEGKPVTNVW